MLPTSLATMMLQTGVSANDNKENTTRRSRKRRNPNHDIDQRAVGTRKFNYVNEIEQGDALWTGDMFGLDTVEIQPICSSSQGNLLSEVVSNVLEQAAQDEDDEESTWLLGECSQSFLRESEADNNLEDDYLVPHYILETEDVQQLRDTICKVPTIVPPPPVPIESLSSSPSQPPPSHNMMSDLELTKCSIDAVKNSEEPALLTLTSFPFRVIYANNAYQSMTGGNNNIIGSTFYDIFVKEGTKGPSFGTCPSLVGKFQQDVVRVYSASNEEGVFSTLQVLPVYKKSEPSSLSSHGTEPSDLLRYYVVTLKQVQVPSGASIVYLPMPSGSMPTF